MSPPDPASTPLGGTLPPSLEGSQDGPVEQPPPEAPPRASPWELPHFEMSPRLAFAGLLGGFALTAATNAVAIAIGAPWPRGGLALRLAHHGFDAGELLGVGALAGAVVALWLRLVRAPPWAHFAAYTAAATPAIYASLGQDLRRQALVVLGGRVETPLLAIFTLLCAMAIPTAHVLGAIFSGMRRLRVVPLVLAAGGVVTNHVLLRDDYPALHCAIAWTAATLAGATLAPVTAALLRRAGARWGERRAVAVGLAVAAAGLLVPPSNAVRLVIFGEPGSVAAWILATAYWSAPSLSPAAAAPGSPWYADRAGAPPVPPTDPRFFAKPPIVVLITIDAVRADDVLDPAHDGLLPAIAALRRSGAVFTAATAPGSQTAVSLTTTFSGRYFSELFWSLHGVGETRFAYAADDTSPRFPELLTARGVATVSFCSVNFLAGEFGIARGFAEEQMIARGRAHAFAKEMIDPLLERLARAGRGPMFLFTHLMEPHAPYDRGAVKTGPLHERYLSELAVADEQIGRVSRVLAHRFADRGVLIVSADHGEAFGEHGTWEHTKTLYEELLHVPLIVRGPGIAARVIEQRVGLVDLGPTVLDLFGVPTPGQFEGQSLVPLLAGSSKSLERPIAAEGRLRRALYLGQSLKAIEDPRRKTVEVYDLASDPGERTNLFDTGRTAAEPAVAALRAFFAAHALGKPGYSPLYKP